MPPVRKNPGIPKVDDAMPCDGSAQDYRRHSKAGEEACPESRHAWAASMKFYRKTGIYPSAQDDYTTPNKLHPFFYRKPKRKKSWYRT